MSTPGVLHLYFESHDSYCTNRIHNEQNKKISFSNFYSRCSKLICHSNPQRFIKNIVAKWIQTTNQLNEFVSIDSENLHLPTFYFYWSLFFYQIEKDTCSLGDCYLISSNWYEKTKSKITIKSNQFFSCSGVRRLLIDY